MLGAGRSAPKGGRPSPGACKDRSLRILPRGRESPSPLDTLRMMLPSRQPFLGLSRPPQSGTSIFARSLVPPVGPELLPSHVPAGLEAATRGTRARAGFPNPHPLGPGASRSLLARPPTTAASLARAPAPPGTARRLQPRAGPQSWAALDPRLLGLQISPRPRS